jgi:beta-galactosidase
MRLLLIYCFCRALALEGVIVQAGQIAPLDLACDWHFALDRADVGTNEHWFNHALPDRIRLSGVLQAQGYGEEISTNSP